MEKLYNNNVRNIAYLLKLFFYLSIYMNQASYVMENLVLNLVRDTDASLPSSSIIFASCEVLVVFT